MFLINFICFKNFVTKFILNTMINEKYNNVYKTKRKETISYFLQSQIIKVQVRINDDE